MPEEQNEFVVAGWPVNDEEIGQWCDRLVEAGEQVKRAMEEFNNVARQVPPIYLRLRERPR